MLVFFLVEYHSFHDFVVCDSRIHAQSGTSYNILVSVGELLTLCV